MLNPKNTLDPAVRGVLKCTTPTPNQLALAGYGFTEAQQGLQQSRLQIDLFPTSPLTTTEELHFALSVGAPVANAYHDWKALKPHLAAIIDLTKLIGNGVATGYNILGYLSARGTTSMSTRYSQQSELLRAFKDAKVEQLIKAALEGCLLLSEDVPKNGSEHLALRQHSSWCTIC